MIDVCGLKPSTLLCVLISSFSSCFHHIYYALMTISVGLCYSLTIFRVLFAILNFAFVESFLSGKKCDIIESYASTSTHICVICRASQLCCYRLMLMLMMLLLLLSAWLWFKRIRLLAILDAFNIIALIQTFPTKTNDWLTERANCVI